MLTNSQGSSSGRGTLRTWVPRRRLRRHPRHIRTRSGCRGCRACRGLLPLRCIHFTRGQPRPAEDSNPRRTMRRMAQRHGHHPRATVRPPTVLALPARSGPGQARCFRTHHGRRGGRERSEGNVGTRGGLASEASATTDTAHSSCSSTSTLQGTTCGLIGPEGCPSNATAFTCSCTSRTTGSPPGRTGCSTAAAISSTCRDGRSGAREGSASATAPGAIACEGTAWQC